MLEKQENETSVYDTETESKKTSRMQPLLGIGLSVLLATATCFSGLHIGDTKLDANLFSFLSRETKADDSIDLTEFWKVWNLLDEKFVVGTTTDALSDQDKVRGAIEGLVKVYGDPYTVYMPPQKAAMFEEDISGNFSGVGMEVGIREDMVTVIAPLPGSPAEKAGLIAGDTIVRINEESSEGLSIDEAVRLIRGERGTEVKFTIFREGDEEFQDITVVRDTIMIPTSKTEIKDDVFVIALYNFNAISESEMQNALREYVKSGKKKLILDLRGNPGGYLEASVDMASWFLPAGKVIVTEDYGANEEDKVHRSKGYNIFNNNLKFVILVNGGSASASEILAGALKEHGIAKIVGTKTFGKGSVQELINLTPDTSLKITVAKWLTPNGNSISNNGLEPDVNVEITQEQFEDGLDPQLDKAIELLR